MTTGRKDRRERLTTMRSGACASSSQDYMRLAQLLLEESADYARRFDGNVSVFALAGIPVLFSALRALLIEANSGMFGKGRRPKVLVELERGPNETAFLARYYGISSELRERLELLYEVRNEIVHPSHMPAGTPHGTPGYLLSLRDERLLQSTHNPASDFNWIAQLQSHSLFVHAWSVIENAARIVITEHHASDEMRDLHLEAYSFYRRSTSVTLQPSDIIDCGPRDDDD